MNESHNCYSPKTGSVEDNQLITHEKTKLNLANFHTVTDSFIATRTGNSDELLD